jgi:hypothetical protein
MIDWGTDYYASRYDLSRRQVRAIGVSHMDAMTDIGRDLTGFIARLERPARSKAGHASKGRHRKAPLAVQRVDVERALMQARKARSAA